MKKLLSIIMTIALLCMVMLPAAAQESAASVLTWQELDGFVETLRAAAMASTPQSENGQPVYDPDDGYALIYDFGILYCNEPVLTDDTVINEAVITSPSFPGLRGVNVDSSLSTLLDAYYSENENLTGDKSFAGLYAGSFLPDYAVWAWVQRDGQRVQSVQYAVHEALASGGEGYTDSGILYTIQDMYVSAIRLYGLNAKATREEVEDNLQTVESLMQVEAYARVPSARLGEELLPFGRQDLIFENVDFLTLTPEIAVDVFGTPVEDEWMDDGENGFIRVMDFTPGSITFVYDTEKKNPKIYMLYIADDIMEGPRGVRIGDYLSDVIDRFPSGEGEFDGETETLYGSDASGSWGTTQYSQDATASVYYHAVIGETEVTLFISFTMLQADEIMLIFD